MTTPTVTASEITERILTLIEDLTPTVADVLPFARHSDRTTALDNVTDPGRMRLVEVKLEAPKIGQFSAAPGATKKNYSSILVVRVGYSMEVWETLEDDVEYYIQDLRDTDLEQLRELLDGSPFVAQGDLVELPGVKLQRFEGASLESGGKVLAIRYSIHYGRAY